MRELKKTRNYKKTKWYVFLFCFLFGHRLIHRDEFIPNITAPIVTKWTHTATCLRCGYSQEHIWELDAHVDKIDYK